MDMGKRNLCLFISGQGEEEHQVGANWFLHVVETTYSVSLFLFSNEEDLTVIEKLYKNTSRTPWSQHVREPDMTVAMQAFKKKMSNPSGQSSHKRRKTQSRLEGPPSGI